MYAKLFISMYDGTLCSRGPWEALVTFQQLLILCDRHGYVDMTPEAISRRTTIPLDIIQKGLAALMKPDSGSRSPAEEGRRVVLINPDREWGYRIVNYLHYRAIMRELDRKQYHHERYAKKKAKQEEETRRLEYDRNRINREEERKRRTSEAADDYKEKRQETLEEWEKKKQQNEQNQNSLENNSEQVLKGVDTNVEKWIPPIAEAEAEAEALSENSLNFPIDNTSAQSALTGSDSQNPPEPPSRSARSKSKPEKAPVHPKSQAWVSQAAQKTQAKGAQVWEYYSKAYERKWGVVPVRNAKTNSCLARLVDALGKEEAPLVAAFYCQHNHPTYVRARHPPELLLRDAAGLRTQWATGRKATTQEARNAEQADEMREQSKRVTDMVDGMRKAVEGEG